MIDISGSLWPALPTNRFQQPLINGLLGIELFFLEEAEALQFIPTKLYYKNNFQNISIRENSPLFQFQRKFSLQDKRSGFRDQWSLMLIITKNVNKNLDFHT